MGIKRLPWLRMLKKTDPEVPLRLPIAAGSITNGEGWWPDSKRKQLLRKLVMEKADEAARKHGIDRREFMASSAGMATTLMMINVINGCSSDGKDGMYNMMPGGSGAPSPAGSGAPNMMMGPGGDGDGTMVMGPGGDGDMVIPPGGDGDMMIPRPTDPPPVGRQDICLDEELAESILMGGGNEIVIDMQSHFATPETNPLGALGLDSFVGQINNTRFPWIVRTPGVMSSGKYDRTEYIKQILMGSPTTIGVLSGISYSVGADGTGTSGFAALSNEDLLGGADFLNDMFPGRILKHCMVMPNDRPDVQMAMMERNASSYHNWKTYPPYQGGAGTGYWLHEGVGPMMIQKGLDLNMPIFCIHKGFPLSGFSAEHCNPRDVGPAAKMFPDAYLVVYHSAFENGLAAGESTQPTTTWMEQACGMGDLLGTPWPEGPYPPDGVMGDVGITWPTEAVMGSNLAGAWGDPATAATMYPHTRGVNSLIKSLRDSGIGPNGTDLGDSRDGTQKWNVYAECGGVWPALMTGRHEEAMHYWGKLLLHVGEDRMVWGTDCLWFGSPAPLIQAFRCFQITPEFQEKYGYPEMTQEIKEKILGRNAARLQSIHPDVDIADKCHNDIVTAEHRTIQKELDEEFGPRRDMMQDVWGPKTRREFMALNKHENEEKNFWSGNVPAVAETRKSPIT